VTTTDLITITALRVPTRLGVTEDERSRPQEVTIDLAIALDLRSAGASDDLNDTVDYGQLTTEVAELVSSSETRLLETLAEKIAGHVCTFTRIDRVTVEIAKAAPPVQEDVGSIAVRITRP